MGDSVSFATRESVGASGFNGLPFPITTKVGDDEVELWGGGFFESNTTYFDGYATFYQSYKTPSNASGRQTPVVGPGTGWHRIPIELAVKLVWRVKYFSLSGSVSGTLSFEEPWGPPTTTSCSLSASSIDGTPVKMNAGSTERSTITGVDKPYHNPIPEFRFGIWHPWGGPDEETGTGSGSVVTNYFATSFDLGAQTPDTAPVEFRGLKEDCVNGAFTHVYMNLSGYGGSVSAWQDECQAGYGVSGGGQYFSEEYCTDVGAETYFKTKPNSSTMSLSLLGENLTLTGSDAIVYNFSYITTPVSGSFSGSLVVGAEEYWPYKNSQGQPVFDTTTGAQINPIS